MPVQFVPVGGAVQVGGHAVVAVGAAVGQGAGLGGFAQAAGHVEAVAAVAGTGRQLAPHGSQQVANGQAPPADQLAPAAVERGSVG